MPVTTGRNTPKDVQESNYVYAADGEANDTYVITLSPVPTAYAEGMVIHFKANTANTDGATLNVNALGALAILKMNDTALATGDIEAGQIVTVQHDGTQFQMTSQVAAAAGGGQSPYGCIVDAAGNGDYLLLGAALDAGEKSIFVKIGTYSETGESTIGSNTAITGEDMTETIIDVDGTTNKRILLAEGYLADLHFENITFKSTTATNYILDQVYSTGDRPYFVYFNKVRFSKGGVTGGYQSSTGSGVGNWYFSNCEFDGGTAAVTQYIDLHGRTNTEVEDGELRIQNCSFFDSPATMVRMSLNSRSIIISGNTFDGTAANECLRIEGGDSRGGIISNNRFTTTSGDGLFIGGGGGDAEDQGWTVSNNHFVNCEIGLYLQSSSHMDIVSGNKFFSNSTSGIKVYYDNNIITGNIFETDTLGIDLVSTADYNLIANNLFEGCTTNLTDASSGVNHIWGNRGLTRKEQKELQIMTNTSGGALVAGDVVVLKAAAAGNEFTTTTTQGDDFVYGVLAENISDTASGYVATQGGIVNMKVDGTTDIAIGDYIGTFTTAKIGMKAAAGDMAIAIALEGYTTDDSSGVIDALLITPRKV